MHTLVRTWNIFSWYLLRTLIFIIVLNVLQAKRKRARTPTPGEYLGVRGIYLNFTAFVWYDMKLFYGLVFLSLVLLRI